MKKFTVLLASFPLAYCFNHPGLLVSSNDLARLQEKLEANLDPWSTCWSALTSMGPGNVPYSPQAVATVDRDVEGDTAANAYLLWQDTAAAFALALRWKVEGNTSYADAAANILTSWSKTLVSIGANDDQYLVAGLQGHELANAGELLRDYAPFRESGLAEFQTMMEDVFLEKNLYFLNHLDGSEHNVKHFFANWELAQVASAMAISVLTDNQTTWDFAVNYFKNGTGNGAINNAITNIVEDPDTGNPLGQGQEEGRDQGHSALDYALLGVIAQQAWNQGEDLYAYNDNRILLGAEYFARYNLGYDVPFENYTNGIVSYTEISSGSRGDVRWAWEVLYNHYVMIKGESAPWTTQYWNLTLETWGGVEIGSGAYGSPSVSYYYDTLGWGTILYHLNDTDVAAARVAFSSSSSVASSTTVSSSSITSSTTVSFLISSPSVTVSSSAASWVMSPLPSVSSSLVASSIAMSSPVSLVLASPSRISSSSAPSVIPTAVSDSCSNTDLPTFETDEQSSEPLINSEFIHDSHVHGHGNAHRHRR